MSHRRDHTGDFSKRYIVCFKNYHVTFILLSTVEKGSVEKYHLLSHHISFHIAVKMKCISILFLIFGLSQAFDIEDFAPKTPLEVKEGGEFQLSCTADKKWKSCEFSHENNGQSCVIKFPINRYQKPTCTDRITFENDGNRKSCVVKVKEAKIEEDAGEWTCKLTRGFNDEDTKTIDVTFKKSDIQDDVIESTTSKTRDSIQNQTQTQEQQKEQSNGKQKLNIIILAFTFLILLGYAIAFCYLIRGKCY